MITLDSIFHPRATKVVPSSRHNLVPPGYKEGKKNGN